MNKEEIKREIFYVLAYDLLSTCFLVSAFIVIFYGLGLIYLSFSLIMYLFMHFLKSNTLRGLTDDE